MIATAEAYHRLHPEVKITWEKRVLQDFAYAPLEQLALRHDLLVVDHPWIGTAAEHACLVPLQMHLDAEYLRDQADHSVGRSYESYLWQGHQYALAIDAATPVAAWRPDRLPEPPRHWDELLALAREGRVILPAMPVDCIMHFYMLCIALGQEPFSDDETVVAAAVGAEALEHLRQLAGLCTPDIYGLNPFQVFERMLASESWIYCPFAYGYSNYARASRRGRILRFGEMVSWRDGRLLVTTLGGTGLAISARCPHVDAAVAYLRFVASGECQRGLYVESGGQPGHRSAWGEESVNRLCGDFFRATLPALDRAWLRPRYPGHLHFQDQAGDCVHQYMREGGDPEHVLARMNDLYLESRDGILR